METDQPIYAGRMRPPELKAVVYELPAFGLTMAAAAVLAYIYVRLAVSNLAVWGFTPFLIILAAILAAVVGFGFWAASFFARRVEVFPDRLRFIMLFGRREVWFSAIKKLEALGREETRRTFFSLRACNLTTAVQGAVRMQRDQDRDWVFSLAEPDAFLAAVEKARRGEPPPTPPADENKPAGSENHPER